MGLPDCAYLPRRGGPRGIFRLEGQIACKRLVTTVRQEAGPGWGRESAAVEAEVAVVGTDTRSGGRGAGGHMDSASPYSPHGAYHGQMLAHGQGPRPKTLSRAQLLGQVWWKDMSGLSEPPTHRDPVVERPPGLGGGEWPQALLCMCGQESWDMCADLGRWLTSPPGAAQAGGNVIGLMGSGWLAPLPRYLQGPLAFMQAS